MEEKDPQQNKVKMPMNIDSLILAINKDIARLASLNIGTDGETAIASRYWRLRRGNLARALNTTTDGVWASIFYANSPAYVEDVTMKVWATRLQAVGV